MPNAKNDERHRYLTKKELINKSTKIKIVTLQYGFKN